MSRRIDTMCTVAVEHSDESLHAHVVLDGDIVVGPGDRVEVHGAPFRLAFGETRTERRQATVTRASALHRLWTRITGNFEIGELYEVSFTSRRGIS
jgi:hypothetical protein